MELVYLSHCIGKIPMYGIKILVISRLFSRIHISRLSAYLLMKKASVFIENSGV